MKILVDATVFSRLNTGIARYERELIGALLRLDRKNSYVFFDLKAIKNRFHRPINPFPGQKFITTSLFPREVYNRLLLRNLAPPIDSLLRVKADLALFPNYFLFPLASTKKSIVFIYDLSFVHYPDYANKKIQKILSLHIPAAVKKATKIVTISKYVKNELIQQYNIDPSKIAVVYPAAKMDLFYPRSAREIIDVKRKYNINKPYVLFTGTLEPRKNISTLLDAYFQLPTMLREEFCLVIVGGKGWRDTGLIAKLENSSKNQVLILGSVTDKELAALYSDASLFTFPSHYEGFGMPPLEAMACGAPVIAADNSSLPEVVGKAAILVDETSVEQLSESVERVLKSPKLQEQLRVMGFKQIKKFSWDVSAKKLSQIISELS